MYKGILEFKTVKKISNERIYITVTNSKPFYLESAATDSDNRMDLNEVVFNY